MRRSLLILALSFVVSVPAHAAKPSYSCTVTTEAAADPGYIAIHITGTVPNKTVPYLRVDGSQEWTGLHNQHGIIDDWTARTNAELPAGSHLAEILDAPDGIVGSNVVTSCTFTVT